MNVMDMDTSWYRGVWCEWAWGRTVGWVRRLRVGSKKLEPHIVMGGIYMLPFSTQKNNPFALMKHLPSHSFGTVTDPLGCLCLFVNKSTLNQIIPMWVHYVYVYILPCMYIIRYVYIYILCSHPGVDSMFYRFEDDHIYIYII